MGEQRETISIRRVHDNDLYQIERVIKEEVNGAELIKIYEEIAQAEFDAKKQVAEIPEQAKKRTETLGKQLEVLQERKEAFAEHYFKLKDKEEAEKETREKEEIVKENSQG